MKLKDKAQEFLNNLNLEKEVEEVFNHYSLALNNLEEDFEEKEMSAPYLQGVTDDLLNLEGKINEVNIRGCKYHETSSTKRILPIILDSANSQYARDYFKLEILNEIEGLEKGQLNASMKHRSMNEEKGLYHYMISIPNITGPLGERDGRAKNYTVAELLYTKDLN